MCERDNTQYIHVNTVTQDLHNHFLQVCLNRCPVLTQIYSKQRQSVHSFIDYYFQSSQHKTYFKKSQQILIKFLIRSSFLSFVLCSLLLNAKDSLDGGKEAFRVTLQEIMGR